MPYILILKTKSFHKYETVIVMTVSCNSLNNIKLTKVRESNHNE
jgi:hypothetical protein